MLGLQALSLSRKTYASRLDRFKLVKSKGAPDGFVMLCVWRAPTPSRENKRPENTVIYIAQDIPSYLDWM